MKRTGLAFILALASGPAAQASAENELVILTQDDAFNEALVEIEGNGNRLEILQEHNGAGEANRLDVEIVGDNNGGPGGASFSGEALSTGLQPGTITQTGYDNTMSVSVKGSDNLFAFAQDGHGNSLSASITGTANQAAVQQQGPNNHAAFSQNGIGNIVSISQTSW